MLQVKHKMKPQETKIKRKAWPISRASGLASKRLLGQIHPPLAAVLNEE
jgi:hypothetical protein